MKYEIPSMTIIEIDRQSDVLTVSLVPGGGGDSTDYGKIQMLEDGELK